MYYKTKKLSVQKTGDAWDGKDLFYFFTLNGQEISLRESLFKLLFEEEKGA